MKLSDLLLNRFLYKQFQQDLETKDSVYDSVNAIPDAVPPLAAGGAAQDINTSNVTINPAQLTPGIPLPPGLLDVANWGWSQTCIFSSASATQVNWGAGTFKSSSGTTYSIGAGNTGVMAAKTYIYLDLNVSSTAYQVTTTPATAVGLGKVLVAVAQNGTTSATYNLNEASQIVGDNILANTINATKMNVGQLSAITADLGSITAGTITGALIRTSIGTTRIELKSDNTILFYDAGEIRTYISNGILTFNRPDGTGCGTIAGWGSNQVGITVGGEGYFFDTGAFWNDSGNNLGTTSNKWANAYFTGTIDTTSHLEVDGHANIGSYMTVGAYLTAYGDLTCYDAYVDTLNCSNIINAAGGNDAIALLDSGFGTVTLVFSEGVYTGYF